MSTGPSTSKAAETLQNVAQAADEFVDNMNPGTEDDAGEQEAEGDENTMEARKKKLEELRKRMRSSAQANRASVVEESAKARITAREAARMERQRKLAETLRQKADAEDRGEDVERQKNWEYTIEENDEWEKKQARKARRADFSFNDDADAARRRYKKDLDHIKPDLESYNRQKEVALGLAPGTLSKPGAASGSSAVTKFDPSGGALQAAPTSLQQQLAAENLYRDANSLLYADNKPSEDAIDRVIGKINKDVDKKSKFSRKRHNEDEGDITYINERNRVFNKKIARYYDKYTTEIRASFERGTAL
ncbi:SYF2-domain-containing protein [Epithele typhae]|uniref:SYF2-domain-containing protein n=1 Tax=Epithele typhae TaxID=378194 RepID=UPI00200778CD|nr:SYF2-domain-containing protein [Epithele typhae]KAH9929069.1 SYF2-domain-containing protein [Epithele typhae]